jgi:hypothetical protein
MENTKIKLTYYIKGKRKVPYEGKEQQYRCISTLSITSGLDGG